MIWVVGSKGMLGSEFEQLLTQDAIFTDKEIDITNMIEISSFVKDKKIDWIINCAAYTDVDKSEENQNTAFLLNQYGAEHLALIAVKKGAKLIHFSTDYVFNGMKKDGYSENDKLTPINIYGMSKHLGEKSITSINTKSFIFRISWLYGKYGNNFVNTMLELFKERDEISVINNQYGSPTNAKELANFIIKHIIKKDSIKYGIYHFSGEGITNWYEVAKFIELHSQKDVKINPITSSKYPQKAQRPAYSYLKKDKLYNIFNYRPEKWQITLREYILNEKIK